MLARFRVAVFAAGSFVGLAGSPLFAQESTQKVADPIQENVVEVQLATEADGEGETLLFSADAENAALAVAGDVVAETVTGSEPAGFWLGVQLALEIPPALAHHLGDAKGALVETVYPESPAAESGIEAYDLILRVGDADVDSNDRLIEAMKSVEAKPIDVLILRGGEKKTISLTPRLRQPAQPATATAQFSDHLLYAVPHMRVLPALGGPDAGAIRHRLVQAYAPVASLPENVKSMEVRIHRDGDEVKRYIQVMTTDGKTFEAENDEELNSFPPEIRAAIPAPQNATKFALRLDAAPSAPQVQQRVIIQAAPGSPAAVPSPPFAVPAPAPFPPSPWVDIVRQHDPASPGNMAYKAVRVDLNQAGDGLQEVKTELSELRATVERIEKLLQKE